MPEARIYQCPHCTAAVEATPRESAQVMSCPICGSAMEIPADEQPLPRIVPGENDLNARRIKLVIETRRGIYRSRSYFIIGAIACFVVAVQLAYMALRHIRAAGLGPTPIAYILFAFGALMAMSACRRRVVALHREVNKPAPVEPGTPPDFSTLGDGSEQWKKLEDVR